MMSHDCDTQQVESSLIASPPCQTTPHGASPAPPVMIASPPCQHASLPDRISRSLGRLLGSLLIRLGEVVQLMHEKQNPVSKPVLAGGWLRCHLSAVANPLELGSPLASHEMYRKLGAHPGDSVLFGVCDASSTVTAKQLVWSQRSSKYSRGEAPTIVAAK